MNSIVPRLSFFPIALVFLGFFSLHTSYGQFPGSSKKLGNLDFLKKNVEPVEVEIVSSHDVVTPGQTFEIAFKVVHERGWHTFWRDSGSIELGGLQLSKWALPKNWEAGEVRYTHPEKHDYKEFDDTLVSKFTFQGTVYHFASITVPEGEKSGPTTIAVEIEPQACSEEDIVGEARCQNFPHKLSLTVEVGGIARSTAAWSEISEYKKEKLPQDGASFSPQAFSSVEGIHLLLDLPKIAQGHDLGDLYFFSADGRIDSSIWQNFQVKDGKVTLALREREALGDEVDKSKLPGVAYASNGWTPGGPQYIELVAPVKVGKAPVDAPRVASNQAPLSIWLILFYAFLGGFVLNIMPCVFPVIGLKIMSFVKQAGEDPKKVAIHGWVFTAGVLLSFFVLAIAIYSLREAGEKAGWGFQMGNPWFVFGLLILMLVIALNLAGVFDVGICATCVGGSLTQKKGYSGTFFSGILATVVATPCSAPFLASALAATITLPTIPFFAVYLTIGAGLAFPYILLSVAPKLLRFLPRPGPWMEHFKVAMSFLMFGAVAFLAYAYSGLVEDLNFLFALIGLAVVALSFWIFGTWFRPDKSGPTRVRALVIFAIFFGAGLWMGRPLKSLEWEPWSPAKVSEALAKGRPVYVDFTAKWCATCQTNKLSYLDKSVQKLIEQKKILLLKADYTQRQAYIREGFIEYGAAIPINLLHAPDKDPVMLPTALSGATVASYFEKLPDPKN